MSELLEKDPLYKTDFISWAAYHANMQLAKVRLPSQISLLLLFTEQAHTTAMIKHTINLVAKVTQYLHPGRTPVITMDQPLFSIAKQIQWFVVVMGGLHIEMNV